jgi:EmrB/QacA subfamily drug resistance transporter
MKAGRERQLVTFSLTLGIFLAAIEATAVAAAMPTAVSELGGVERYSWVFTAYLLTSTAAMPLYGKLADLYGRRRIFQLGISVFIVGSVLCGQASSLNVLIAFRAIQGLGAAGLMPVTATIAADIYSLQERGRVQGAFAGTWAVAGLLGPLIGGWITDNFSWRLIFYASVPLGFLAMALVGRFLREEIQPREHAFDLLGTCSLTAAVTCLLVALTEGTASWGWGDPRTLGLLAVAFAGLAVFLWQERRAPEPMLPLDIFHIPIVAVASAGNLVLGMMLYSLSTYVPIFGQGVLGGTAVDAGSLLIPLSLGWTFSSTVGGRFLMRFTYRTFLLWGAAVAFAGCSGIAAAGLDTTRLEFMAAAFFVCLGFGWVSLPFLLGPQNAVPWQKRGVATSSVQFFRSIGGALAVAGLGALFHARQTAAVVRRGLADGPDIGAALDPELRAGLDPVVLQGLQEAVMDGLDGIFTTLALLAGIIVVVALAFPRGSAEELAWPEKPPP